MPIINGKYLQPWNVPDEGEERAKPEKLPKQAVRTRKRTGGARVASSFNIENRKAAEAPNTRGIEDFSDLGRDDDQ